MAAHVIEHKTGFQETIPGVGHIEREKLIDQGVIYAGDSWQLYDNNTPDRKLIAVVSVTNSLLVWLVPDEDDPPAKAEPLPVVPLMPSPSVTGVTYPSPATVSVTTGGPPPGYVGPWNERNEPYPMHGRSPGYRGDVEVQLGSEASGESDWVPATRPIRDNPQA